MGFEGEDRKKDKRNGNVKKKKYYGLNPVIQQRQVGRLGGKKEFTLEPKGQ